MSFIYQGPLLAQNELEIISRSIDDLSHEWTRRAPDPIPIYTLGAATYLDARQSSANYKKFASQKNPVLHRHFKWLYSRLLDTLSNHFGSAVLEPELALPGFHIFGGHRDRPLSPLLCQFLEKTPASVHVDTPYKNHLIHWLRYTEIDFLNPLSITVCIELPECGSGLNTWHLLEKETVFHGHPVVEEQFDRNKLAQAVYRPYTQGWMYVSSGHQVHQIASGKKFLPHDRRLTLQAHAVRCDGLWRLFF